MFIVELCHSGIDFGHFQRALGVYLFKISRQSISPATQKKRFKITFSGLFYSIIRKNFKKSLALFPKIRIKKLIKTRATETPITIIFVPKKEIKKYPVANVPKILPRALKA